MLSALLALTLLLLLLAVPGILRPRAAAHAIYWSAAALSVAAAGVAVVVAAAGAIAATRPGAQPAMPTRDEVEDLL